MTAYRHDPLATLRQRNFLLFAASRFFAATAMTLLSAAIAWHVYRISGSAFHLGLIGLARFLPSLGLSLIGGALADSHDRRRIVIASQLVPLVCAAALFTATASGAVSLPLIYALVLLLAVAAAFENPARQALLPLVVRPETFVHAITVNSSISSLGFVTGPALGGLCIAYAGVDGAYAAEAGLLMAAIALMFIVSPRAAENGRRAVSLDGIREGVRFVWSRQPLLGAMTLDMFAVIFGGAAALLPIYATDILRAGPRGYGLLSASLELGALLMSITLILLPPLKRVGLALLVTVALFGVGTVAFGLSRSLPLSVALYMFIGMADQVSVVMRQTTVQLTTPDELRGRVSSVNMLFIGASNQLGAVESGFVAALTGATFAVVSGGLGCLAVVAVVAAKMPELRRYRIEPRAPLLSSSAPPAAALAPGEPP